MNLHKALFLLVVFTIASTSFAQQRTWTDATGKLKVEAMLLTIKGGKAYLEKADGQLAQVAIDRLSTTDLEYLETTAEYRGAVADILDARRVAAGLPKKRGFATIHVEDKNKSGLIRELKQKGEQFRSVAFSADGARLAATTVTRSLVIFDIDSANVLSMHTLPTSAINLREVVFTPDGKGVIATAHNGKLHRWDLDENGILQAVGFSKIGERDIKSVHISADSEHGVSLDEEGTFAHWRTSDCQVEFTHSGFEGYQGCVFASKHGGQALASNSNVLALYDLKSRAVLQSIRIKDYGSDLCTFNSDGSIFAYCDASKVQFVQTKTGRRLPTINAAGSPTAIRFSDDNKYFLVATSKEVEKWNFESFKKEETMSATNGDFANPTFSPDGIHMADFKTYGEVISILRFTPPK